VSENNQKTQKNISKCTQDDRESEVTVWKTYKNKSMLNQTQNVIIKITRDTIC